MPWFDTVRRNIRLASEICDGTAGTRDALLGLWLALDIVPTNYLDMYSAIPEAELAAEASRLEFDAIFADVQEPGGRTTDIRALIRDLAVRIRALETHLFRDQESGSRPTNANEYRVAFDGFEAYLIQLPPKNRAPRDRQPFRLRGLAASRLLPLEVGGYQVELVVPPDPRGGLRRKAKQELQIGAGLFEGIKFHTVEVEGGFAIPDATSPNQLDVIEAQLLEASSAKCGGVVYPELTIGEPVLREMIARIKDGSWTTAGLSLIVAGSRHVEIGDHRYNVATILDGYGEGITEHRKLFSFHHRGHVEAIDLGTVLNVVLLEDSLFAFGICLDYCNPREPPPYLVLDVDFVLVPSCGEEATMKNHIQRSTEVLRDMGSHSLIVQQYFRENAPQDAPLGYVLSRRDPAVPTIKDVATMEPWQTAII
jgi:hypothetical protein